MSRGIVQSIAAIRRLCLPACSLVLLALLSTCGNVPTPAAAPVVALPSPLPLPLNTRPEGAAGAPCGPLWPDGEQATLRGLYRTAGKDGYLDVSRAAADTPPCWARFFLLDQDLGLGSVEWEAPVYVEVVGLPSSSRWNTAGLWDVQVLRWTVLPLDLAAARAACRQAVIEQTTALQTLDWASLALPGYVTGTAGFRPSAAELAGVTVQLDGADDRAARLLLTARGPNLPSVQPLVTRWASFECQYDIPQGQVVQIVATIRGEVQE
jgi:hypothetical protein